MQDDQAKTFNPGLLELTLLWFEVELVLAEVFQDKAHDAVVLLQHFGIDEDVIKVAKILVSPKNITRGLNNPLVGLEGSLSLTSLLDAHIVVAPLDVQFSEVLHTEEVVDELGDEVEGAAVLHGHSVENSVVLS
ncbi:hypothetical protein C0989_007609 [Termitomyces sp. Mn162]|nr:hypothetical protein C0989_007609 [Termitomyces sp. Mn162]